MEQIILEAQKRTDFGTARANRLRKHAFIPAVVYGEGKGSLNIQVALKDFMNLLAGHAGESFVFTLRVKDGKTHEDKSVLIKEIQYHPVRDSVIHVDFNEISLTKTIKVKVPVAAKGEAVGVKQDGGMLEHILWELEIECLPTKIPKAIEVDVSNLKIGDSVQIKNLSIPEGVKVLHDQEASVLAVVHPKEEAIPTAEEVAAGGEVKEEPEVIKKEKPEEAEEAAEGKGAAKEKEKEEKK